MLRPIQIQVKIDKAKAEVPIAINNKYRPGINKATGSGWRFVHDGKKIIAPPFKADSFEETTTKHTIFVGYAENECIAEIKRLKLVTLNA